MISMYMPITPIIRRDLERRLRAGATPLELADERDLDPAAVRAIADRMCEPYRWSDEQERAHVRLDLAGLGARLTLTPGELREPVLVAALAAARAALAPIVARLQESAVALVERMAAITDAP